MVSATDVVLILWHRENLHEMITRQILGEEIDEDYKAAIYADFHDLAVKYGFPGTEELLDAVDYHTGRDNP